MPFIVDDLLIAGLIGAGLGAAGGAAKGYAGKKRADRANANAGLQTAWSGLSNKMSPGQTVGVPDPGEEAVLGGITGAVTGVGTYGDLAKSFKPEGSSITVANIGGNSPGATPGLVGSMPSLEDKKSLWEIQSNINSGMGNIPPTTMASRGPASLSSPRKYTGFTGYIPTTPWNKYGGTGGR